MANALRPYRLRVEYNANPIGLDVDTPRFCWAVDNEGIRGDIQSAYQIIITNTETSKTVADTGKIITNFSSQIVVNNFSISSNPQSRYSYSVQLWNKSNIASIVSTAFFVSSVLSPSDWDSASWIGIPSSLNPNKSNDMIMNQFRTEFDLNATSLFIQKAICYIASPNYYIAYVNNIRTDEHVLGPFTQFDYTTYYEMIECTNMLQINKRNVFGLTLGNGRYTQQNVGSPMVKVMIDITLNDGSKIKINSNSKDWFQGYGPIRMNDIYRGEWYDATKETKGWLQPYYDMNTSVWTAANIISKPVIGELKSSSIMPVIQKFDSFTALSITNPSPNVYVFDFGQNVAGICQLFVAGNKDRGRNITMIHSEQIDQLGFVVQLYGKQNEIATYTLRGDGTDESYIPSFTSFGYQYVEMHIPASIQSVPSKQSLISHFIHTGFNDIGSIEFGPPTSPNANMMNTFESMTRYSSLSNYMNVPTDCPQRERFGYLGDGQLTSDTVCYHWDIASSYTKWLWDIHDTQIFVNGTHGLLNTLPSSSPYFFHGGGNFPGDIAWSAGYIKLVDQMWKYYGDTKLIRVHYNGMKKLWLYFDAYINSKTNVLPANNPNVSRYGDWCAVPTNNTKSVGLETDGTCFHESSLLNTCIFAKQCLYLSQLAEVIGNEQDSKLFYDKYMSAKQGIYNKFWNAQKGYFEDNNTNVPLNQTAPFSTLQSLALDLGVLSNEEEIKSSVDAIVYDITVNNRGHLNQGIIGIKFILETLCENKQCLVAMNGTLQHGYPSYDYWYENGATTLWEEWTSSRYNNHGGSKNHIMFGTQSAFYFKYLAGIRQATNSVNWKKIIIDPFTNCSILNVYNIESTVEMFIGSISVSFLLKTSIAPTAANNTTLWEMLNVSIPSGSTASVFFRRLAVFNSYIDVKQWVVTESDVTIWQNMEFMSGVDGILNGTAINHDADDALRFMIDSGSYSFKFMTQN